MGTSSTRGKRLTFGMISILLATAATTLVLEIVSRTVMTSRRYEFPEWMYETVENPMLGYRMVPSFEGKVYTSAYQYEIRTNALGFRGPEVEDDGRHVIGVFGDSFGYGQGVEADEMFSTRIQERMGEGDYQVVNTSHAGYQTNQEYEMYQLVDQALGLNTVILHMYVNDINDIRDQLVPGGHSVYRGVLYGEPPSGAFDAIKAWLAKNSELAAQAYARVVWLRESAAGNAPNIPAYVLANYETTAAREIGSTRDLISRWAAEARTKGQRFIVFFIPDRVQVEPHRSTTLRYRATEADTELDLDVTHRWLLALAGSGEIEYVDVVEPFRRALMEGEGPLYFESNNHTNAAGHRLIGEVLACALAAPTIEPPAHALSAAR